MNPKNSVDLFNKIRSQFTNVRLGDESGAATADPASAVFFEFEFQEDADTFGSVSISLADGENMKVYYNRDLVNKIDEDSRDEWYAFLKELKDYAVEHQLGFDVRDITKNNLSQQDYENIADANKTVNTDEMSEELSRITKLAGVNEGLTGSAKRSYENLDKTKLIIRHKGKVDETVPGARSRQIQSLYIENEDGERFKYPLTHLAGARAMMRHVANGGRPHDEFGQHIVQTSEDIAKLQSFSRYVTNKDQLNDNAGDIIENTKLQLENLREYMRNLSKQSHYESSCKSYRKKEDQVLDDETVNKLREKFTMKNLDSRVEEAFPLINKIMSELDKEEPKDKEVTPTILPKDAEPIDAPSQAPVDHGAIVQGYLNDPDSKLILRKDKAADNLIKNTNFTDRNTFLGAILSDIASRLISKDDNDDRVANFASRVADEMSQEKQPSFKATPDYIKNKKIAMQLAKRYMDDYKKMQKDPQFKDEVRKDPQEIKKFKNIKGQEYGDKSKEYKPKEEVAFETWVDNIDKEAPVKEDSALISAYKQIAQLASDVDENPEDAEDQWELSSEVARPITKILKKIMDYDKGEQMPDGSDMPYPDVFKKVSMLANKGAQTNDPKMAAEIFKTMSNVYDMKQVAEEAPAQEGNQFAQAVQKAKAAGMKAGDKFKVGDQEYTLKDAIELAGLQLEEFFSEEELAVEAQIDRIKDLANYQ